jgi:PAS domain S-box-containing protein
MTKKLRFLQKSSKRGHETYLNPDKFVQLIEENGNIIVLISAAGELLYASPSLTHALGYTYDELPKLLLTEILHPGDIPEQRKIDAYVSRCKQKSFLHQQRIRHRNGNWIWFEGAVTNMVHIVGINAFVFNFRDITERKVAEEKLEQSEKRFRNFFENAPEGITILNTDSFKFVKYNANALKMLKFSAQEFLSKTPESISPQYQPDGRRSEEKAAELIGRTIKGEELFFEWVVKNGENELVTFEVRLMPLPAGEPSQIYASFVDITHRKEMENRLRDQNRKLSEIASFQSHQVRKPIASILGLISLFNFNNLQDPINAEVILKMNSVAKMIDSTIKSIISQTGGF